MPYSDYDPNMFGNYNYDYDSMAKSIYNKLFNRFTPNYGGIVDMPWSGGVKFPDTLYLDDPPQYYGTHNNYPFGRPAPMPNIQQPQIMFPESFYNKIRPQQQGIDINLLKEIFKKLYKQKQEEGGE